MLVNDVINIANPQWSILSNESLPVGQSLCVILNPKNRSDEARIDFEQVAVIKMQGRCLGIFMKTSLLSWSKSSLKDRAKW